jgi:hypothetical protein
MHDRVYDDFVAFHSVIGKYPVRETLQKASATTVFGDPPNERGLLIAIDQANTLASDANA